MTAIGTVAGSLGFMSRDQLINFKYAKPNSDVWRFGATFNHILTGFLPRDFQSGQDPVEAILNNKIIPVRERTSDIPENIAAIIHRSLSDETTSRYQNAGEFYSELSKSLD